MTCYEECFSKLNRRFPHMHNYEDKGTPLKYTIHDSAMKCSRKILEQFQNFNNIQEIVS